MEARERPPRALQLSDGDQVKQAIKRLIGADSYERMKEVVGAARDDLTSPYPLGQKLRAWRRGFHAETVDLYDLEHNDPSAYVSDFQRSRRGWHVNQTNVFFRHKLATRSYLLNAGFAQPETLALVANGRIQLNPLSPSARVVSPAEFESFLLADGGRFIAKPEDGTFGTGVYFLEPLDGRLVLRRGEETPRPFSIAAIGTCALVERLVQQGGFWSALNPESTNTVRVLTGWAPGDAAPMVIAAVQRIGTRATAPTDNWAGGGISARVDLATGRLGAGVKRPAAKGAPPTRHARHPDSGAEIEGAILPRWEEVQAAALRALTAIPLVRYAGWDVIVPATGEPIMLEGNGNSSLDLIQVHGGLLREPHARRFYQALQMA